MELQRVQALVEFSEAISHFETFRETSENTIAMDADTLALINRLRTIQEKKHEMEVILSPSTRNLQDLKNTEENSQISLLEQIKSAKSIIQKLVESIMSVNTYVIDVKTYLNIIVQDSE
ncbi:hypothetical protein HK096_011028, partial [Nowakowskiella sp. JEL0078]